MKKSDKKLPNSIFLYSLIICVLALLIVGAYLFKTKKEHQRVANSNSLVGDIKNTGPTESPYVWKEEDTYRIVTPDKASKKWKSDYFSLSINYDPSWTIDVDTGSGDPGPYFRFSKDSSSVSNYPYSLGNFTNKYFLIVSYFFNPYSRSNGVCWDTCISQGEESIKLSNGKTYTFEIIKVMSGDKFRYYTFEFPLDGVTGKPPYDKNPPMVRGQFYTEKEKQELLNLFKSIQTDK